jgi:hypothetical protein
MGTATRHGIDVAPATAGALSVALDRLAILMGAVSIAAGLGVVSLFALVLHVQEAASGVQRPRLIDRFTPDASMSLLLGMVAAAAIPGGLGLELAWRSGRPRRRVSRAAVAARVSIFGLALDALVLPGFLAPLGDRWISWG